MTYEAEAQYEVKNSKMLNDLFKELVKPKMIKIEGKPKPKVDTGLDNYILNNEIAKMRKI